MYKAEAEPRVGEFFIFCCVLWVDFFDLRTKYNGQKRENAIKKDFLTYTKNDRDIVIVLLT